MQYAPTRVHEKFGGFHISPPEYTKNAPDFILPNRDAPKSRPVLGPNLRRRTFQGVCNTPLHVYVQNPPGFIFPHTDTPKTRPVLDPNLRRKTFRGVCFFALHGHVQNLAGFIFPHTDTLKTRPILPFPIGIRPKPTQFHIPPPEYTKNAPGFRPKPSSRNILGAYAIRPYTGTHKIWRVSHFPNRDAPKTHPILGANPRRETFWGVCNTPYTDTPKTCPILGPNSCRRTFRGVCFCTPTRVCA